MNVRYSKDAVKALKQMDARQRERFNRALEKLEHEPPDGDIKRLTGKDGAYRLRIGEYRVLFHYGNDHIVVDRIVTRGHAYR